MVAVLSMVNNEASSSGDSPLAELEVKRQHQGTDPTFIIILLQSKISDGCIGVISVGGLVYAIANGALLFDWVGLLIIVSYLLWNLFQIF